MARSPEPGSQRAHRSFSRASGSRYWLIWETGIDQVGAVGFDANGRVTYPAFGGT